MYNGWLLKIGDYIFPMEYIQYDSLDLQYITQDLDSYTDGEGELHRNALAHHAAKIVFNTIPMNNDDYGKLMENITAQLYTDNEKRGDHENAFLGTVFIPKLNAYITQDMYMVDDNPSIRSGEILPGGKFRLNYNPIRLAFIGY